MGEDYVLWDERGNPRKLIDEDDPGVAHVAVRRLEAGMHIVLGGCRYQVTRVMSRGRIMIKYLGEDTR